MLLHSSRRLESTLLRARAERGDVALATIVETTGSTYRKTGTMVAITPSGDIGGLLSGGCLEAEIAGAARMALSEKTPRLLTFDLTGDGDFLVGSGKGCAGRIVILIEPLTASSELRSWDAALLLARAKCDIRAAVVYEVDGVGAARVGDKVLLMSDGTVLMTGHDQALSGLMAAGLRAGIQRGAAEHEAFLWQGGRVRVASYLVSAPRVLRIFGAGVDAEPLVSMGLTLGFEVHVHDHRPANLDIRRFAHADSMSLFDPSSIDVDPGPREAVVVMTHNLLVDAEVLRWGSRFGPDRVAYMGVLGPASRFRKLSAWLDSEHAIDIESAFGERLHAPIGLDLGGEGEAMIALAVLGEIQKFQSGRLGTSLSERRRRPSAVALPLHRAETAAVRAGSIN